MQPLSTQRQAAEPSSYGLDTAKWGAIGFRHLEALAGVAREGSFRRAADSLGYVQSAISGQISQLEQAAGVQLIERSNGTPAARLTAAGGVLLEHAAEILARVDAARTDIGMFADADQAALRIGVLDGLAPGVLTAVFSAFQRRVPDSKATVLGPCGEKHAFQRLAGGELDIVLAEKPIPDGPFDCSVLGSDRYVLVLASGSPLARRSRLTDPAELANVRLLMTRRTAEADGLCAALRQHGADTASFPCPSRSGVVQAMAAVGLGTAIMPRLAVDGSDSTTATVELPDRELQRTLLVARHRERAVSPTAEAFVKAAKEVLADLMSAHS